MDFIGLESTADAGFFTEILSTVFDFSWPLLSAQISPRVTTTLTHSPAKLKFIIYFLFYLFIKLTFTIKVVSLYSFVFRKGAGNSLSQRQAN